MGKKMEKELFGTTLKLLRLNRGITLQELSNATGLSVSFLSLVENDKTGISFSNMQKILKFLDFTIADLLNHSNSGGRVVKLDDAKSIGPDIEHVEIFELVRDPKEKKIWPGYFVMEPGASIGPMQHEGEEFSHIIEGTIEVVLNDPQSGKKEVYILQQGDTIYYQSTYLHTYINKSNKKSIFLAAVTPPTF
jgi:transcriptional regulator with XRE-family HTH domain